MIYYSDETKRKVLVLVAVIVVVFGAYQLYLMLHFRVVNTEPKTSNFAAVSPFMRVNFNKKLSHSGLAVTSSYSAVSSYYIKNKSLFINLKSPLTADYKYYVKVSVTDVAGEKISNKVFLFTPKNIAWKELSKDQQDALMKAQQQRQPSVSDIYFSGINNLLNYGVTQTQVGTLEEYFFKFSPKAKKVSIDKGSIAPVPHNRNSASTNATINFGASIDSKKYNAKLDYSLLNDYARLYLYDASGKQVFDSLPPADRTET